eukprot:2231843-Amphidinium_carterae.1
MGGCGAGTSLHLVTKAASTMEWHPLFATPQVSAVRSVCAQQQRGNGCTTSCASCSSTMLRFSIDSNSTCV